MKYNTRPALSGHLAQANQSTTTSPVSLSIFQKPKLASVILCAFKADGRWVIRALVCGEVIEFVGRTMPQAAEALSKAQAIARVQTKFFRSTNHAGFISRPRPKNSHWR